MMSRRKFKAWVNSLVNEGYDLSDYTWDEIYEVYLDEALPAPGTSSGAVTMYRRPRALYGGTPRDTEFDRPLNANTPRQTGRGTGVTRPRIGSLPADARQVTQYPQGVSTGVGGGNAGGSTSAGSAATPRPNPRPNPSAGGGSYSGGGGSRSAPAAAPRPAAPVLSKQGGVEGTGVGKDFKARNWTDTERSRYTNLAQSRAASSGSSSSSSGPALGTLGKTQFERRTPTSAELRGAQAARASGAKPEDALRAAQAAGRGAGDAASIRTSIRTLPSSDKSLNVVGGAGQKPTPPPTTGPITLQSPSISAVQIPGVEKNRNLKQDFDFGKSNYITEDINYLYHSIYEGNRVDQDGDGDNDGADVMIARMIASGMSREEAIRRTRNKSYNKNRKESYELYDLVLEYMIENGYADDEESAEVIFENMSGELQNAIIDEIENS